MSRAAERDGAAGPSPLRRALVLAAAVSAVNLGGAYALDALGLVESLLSPGGGRAVVVLPLAIGFYAARLLALFVAPGLVIAALVDRLARLGR